MSAHHTILLVEDNADDVLLVKRALRKCGIQSPVHVLGNGQAAIDYLAGNGEYAARDRHPLPSLVLLDVKLPLKSGIEVLRWIRAHPSLATAVVVMLTSSAEPRDVEAAYRGGANSYLVKPAAPQDMLEVIRAIGLYWLAHNVPPPEAASP